MKRFAAGLLLFALILCLCACNDGKEPEEIADIPNIDQNILDAHRYLGNSYENYSSEDTLLVEYGNRIYHAYNSQHEIMEYCTANDKERSLGIYGTDLSVYKNVLYYIGENLKSIRSYDLATGIDSVWITGDEIEKLMPCRTYRYPRLSDLIVTDYGVCLLYGQADKHLVHLSFNKELIATNYSPEVSLGDPGFNLSDMIIVSPDLICATETINSVILVYDMHSATFKLIDTPYELKDPKSDGDGYVFFTYSVGRYSAGLIKLDISSIADKTADFKIIPGINKGIQAKYGDFVYYNVAKDSYVRSLVRTSLSKNTTFFILDDFTVWHISFTSDGKVYGITDHPYNPYAKHYFRADIDFKNITYLD